MMGRRFASRTLTSSRTFGRLPQLLRMTCLFLLSSPPDSFRSPPYPTGACRCSTHVCHWMFHYVRHHHQYSSPPLSLARVAPSCYPPKERRASTQSTTGFPSFASGARRTRSPRSKPPQMTRINFGRVRNFLPPAKTHHARSRVAPWRHSRVKLCRATPSTIHPSCSPPLRDW